MQIWRFQHILKNKLLRREDMNSSDGDLSGLHTRWHHSSSNKYESRAEDTQVVSFMWKNQRKPPEADTTVNFFQLRDL